MPMRSKAQRRYLWATNPEVAREFEDATPEGAKLPEKVKKGKMKKSAAAVLLTVLQLNNLKHAMDAVGLAPPATPPRKPAPGPRPRLPLSQPPTAATPPAPSPAKKSPEDIALEAGRRAGFRSGVGSVLMPPTGR